jgi:hypothetical protein
VGTYEVADWGVGGGGFSLTRAAAAFAAALSAARAASWAAESC